MDCSPATPTITPACFDCAGDLEPGGTSASPASTQAPELSGFPLDPNWVVEAIHVASDVNAGSDNPRWEDNTHVRIADGVVELPADPLGPLTSSVIWRSPQPSPPRGDVFTSPDGQYRWECIPNESLRVVSSSGGEAIAEVEWQRRCPGPDWPTPWSPDSSRLAFIADVQSGPTLRMEVFLLDLRSLPARHWPIFLDISFGSWGDRIEWVTSEVLTLRSVFHAPDGSWPEDIRFLRAETGRLLATQTDPTLAESPDGQWLGFARDGLALYRQPYDLLYEYEAIPGVSYKVEGWSPDGSSFFVTRRPPPRPQAEEDLYPVRSEPWPLEVAYGVLEFDTAHPGLSLEWLNAVEIEWDPGFRKAFVLRAEPDLYNAEVILGQVYDLGSRAWVGNYDVGDPPITIYGDLRPYVSQRRDASLIPIAWSSSASCLAFGHKEGIGPRSGSLILVGPDGLETLLADQLERYYPESMLYAFSPDGRHLLAVHGPDAWIARVPIDC
jgi:hypothetical protein